MSRNKNSYNFSRGEEISGETPQTYKRITVVFGFVILALAALIVWLVLLYMPGRLEKTEDLIKEEYPLLNPAQGMFEKEDLIVTLQPLREELQRLTEGKRVAVYFEVLNSGANISINKNLTLWAASLMKVPIAMAVMKKIEDGKWKFSNELVLFNGDKDELFGELYKKDAGSRFTIEELLKELLVNSDNTARNIFARNLDSKDLENVYEYLGIEDIFTEEYNVTVKRYAALWRSLYLASYLSPEHSQYLIEIMTQTPFNQYLAKGIPADVIFSHKIGEADPFWGDAGIVYVPNRPYLLVVMMEEPDQEKAKELMGQISKAVYEYVSSY